ncbi:hypothetical protein K3495_g11343 [Podosphaera aphanis]|nr:hypothetical protein K3495_g11343 [Podosphaera aphanis]
MSSFSTTTISTAVPSVSNIRPSTSTTALPSSSKCRTATKKFICKFLGCGKLFARPEHLHRHALNHQDGNNTCLRCMTHFHRRDLLDRHMVRHKEKDNEAGGEGLGVLVTRKRLWRDENGNIVTSRRPACLLESSMPRLNQKSEKEKSGLIKGQSLLGHENVMSCSSTHTSPVEFSTKTSVTKNKTPQLDSWSAMTGFPSPPMSGSNAPQIEMEKNLGLFYDKSLSIIFNSGHEIINSSLAVDPQAEFGTIPSWATYPVQMIGGTILDVVPYDRSWCNLESHDWQP